MPEDDLMTVQAFLNRMDEYASEPDLEVNKTKIKKYVMSVNHATRTSELKGQTTEIVSDSNGTQSTILSYGKATDDVKRR